MPSLLDLLRNPDAQNAFTAAMGIAPPSAPPNYTGVQAPVFPMGQPSVPSQSPMASSLTAPGQGQGQGDGQSEDVTVTGDNWKPTHKRTLLGGIYDTLVGGNKFQNEADQANLSDALKGLTRDPESVIRHVAQVNPEAAVKLWNMWKDNTRADGAQERLLRVYDDKNLENTRAIVARGLSGTDEKTYPTMLQRMKTYAQKRNVDWTELGMPDVYDPDQLGAIARGEIPVARRATIDETTDHHLVTEGQTDTSLGIRRDTVNNTKDYRNARLGQIGAHNAVTEAQGQAKIDAKKTRVLNTPQGPGTVSSDGNKLMVMVNGEQRLFLKTGVGEKGTQWKRVK